MISGGGVGSKWQPCVWWSEIFTHLLWVVMGTWEMGLVFKHVLLCDLGHII